MTYPWYETIQGCDLQQGDIFRSYPVFIPHVTFADIQAASIGQQPQVSVVPQVLDVIVVSQSCDLKHTKVDTVIVCPVWPLTRIDENSQNKHDAANQKEKIRRGENLSAHMLKDDGKRGLELSYVEFRRIFATQKSLLIDFASHGGHRVRLLPPYREHLSQAFARYFMRVGLPIDIQPFK